MDLLDLHPKEETVN